MNQPATGIQHPPSEPFVSVVVPLKNELLFVDRSINSFLTQDYPSDRFEIIIADGCSSDGSKERIEYFAALHENIKLVNNPGEIRASGLNRGIRSAKGDFIVIMDFHVIYPTSYIRDCITLLQQGKADNVGGVIRTVPGSQSLIGRCIALLLTSPFGVGGQGFRTTETSGYVDTVPFGAFKRDLIDEVGEFDESLIRTEDNEFNSRLLSLGKRIYMSADIVSCYYSRPTIRALYRQAYGNGRSHIDTLLSGLHAFKLKYYIPMLFFMAVATGALGVFWHPAYIPAGVALGAYLVVAIFVSVVLAAKEGLAHLFVLPWLFLGYHLSYGFGSFIGLLRLLRPTTVWRLVNK